MAEIFSRRYGFRSQSEPVAYDQVPDTARIRLRESVDRYGRNLVGGGEGFPTLLKMLANQIGRHPPAGNVREAMDQLLYDCNWIDFLDICEKVIGLAPSDVKVEMERRINDLLAESGMQWQVEDGRLVWRGGTPLFAQSVQHALSILRADPKFQGPVQQFENAWRCLSSRPPDIANCIKDAIGAVEGVARIIEGSKEILSRLLDPLAKRLGFHPALREAIGKLYAYRGDEEGIAHGATQPLKVGTEEAELMLHWSAAAIIYLLRKSGP